MIATVFIMICVVSLALAAAATIYRIAAGPSLLDRVLAADVLLAILATALCVEMAVHHHINTLPVVICLAVVGFIGSVTVARFVHERPEEDDTTQEAAAELLEGGENAR